MVFAICILFRFSVIFYPAKTIITPSRAMKVIALIWLLPIIVQTPWIYLQTVRLFMKDGVQIVQCFTETENEAFVKIFILVVVFVTCYFVPLAVITVFYTMIGRHHYRDDGYVEMISRL